jgi:hypothetical protein
MNNDQNQPTNPPQNDNQESQPQQIIHPIAESTEPPQVPGGLEANAVNPVQATVPQSEISEAFVSQLQITTPLKSKNLLKRRGPLEIVIILILIVLVLAASGYLLITHNNTAAKFTYDHTLKGSGSNLSPTNNSTGSSGQTNQKDIAFGASATHNNFLVKILDVINSPLTAGDAANTGMKYVAIHMSETNSGNSANFIDGDFTYKPINGQEVIQADVVGPTAATPNKKVTLTGKTLLSANYLNPGESVDGYKIYQVPSDDMGKGKVLWHAGTFDTTSEVYAIFDTN